MNDLSKEHKIHEERFKDAREDAVKGWLKGMTTEGVRRIMQDLKARKKYDQEGREGWKISDLDQVVKEFNDRTFKNRV